MQTAHLHAKFLSELTSRIARWCTSPVQVTLFGSAARGDMTDESDIDLLFIVEDDADDDFFENLNDLAIDTSEMTGNDVRPLVYEASEVSPAPIFDSILREGIHVYGDETWLRRHLGEQGPPPATRLLTPQIYGPEACSRGGEVNAPGL